MACGAGYVMHGTDIADGTANDAWDRRSMSSSVCDARTCDVERSVVLAFRCAVLDTPAHALWILTDTRAYA
eukprot:3323779-Rhodomonas_salina.1